jgi:hypothetical protein
VVVGGMELRGMSTTTVTPPEDAARVPVAKPSQSVRPGSLRWTWALWDVLAKDGRLGRCGYGYGE